MRAELAAELCRPPTLVDARAILRRAQDRPAFLVPEMIPARDLTLITGDPGAKKSWIAYDLVRVVAQGGTWLGVPVRRQALQACAALVLNYDNSTPECGRRFLRLGLQEADPVRFHSLDIGAPLRMPEAAEKLAVVADALRPSLILIDTFRQAHTCDENSSKEMMGIMGSLKRLYACGAAVVVVHHSGKTPSESSKSRGSQEIDGSATAVLHVSVVEKSSGLQSVYWAKHRSWPMPEANETVHFRVTDYGERTRVERADKPARRERRQ